MNALSGTTTASARRTVTTCVLVTGALVGVRDVTNGHAPSVRFAVGLAMSAVFLGVMAEGAPGVASGFALLMAVGAVTVTGSEVFTKIKKGVSQ